MWAIHLVLNVVKQKTPANAGAFLFNGIVVFRYDLILLINLIGRAGAIWTTVFRHRLSVWCLPYIIFRLLF